MELLNIVRDGLENGNKNDITEMLPELQRVFLRALDYRNLHANTNDSKVETIEQLIIKTFVTLVPKLSDVTFRPLFYKVRKLKQI